MSEQVGVQFTLNGKPVFAQVAPETTLLRFLRDEMGLTGTKNGCSTNHCGACMVLVELKATKSCLVKLTRLGGKRVTTIEGLSKPGELSPIQAAFLASGAVQCGFCTPGLIVSTHSLLTISPEPSDEEILEGLKDNICRCTGYVKIIAAVKLAARWLKHPAEVNVTGYELGIGWSAPDKDGQEKVNGCLVFADDIYMENMLFGKIVWSSHPHAEILAADKTDAEGLPGVAAIFTAKDIPGHNGMGSLTPDQPVLCQDRVRFMGDVIAVVYAETPAAAEAAAREVRVDYRTLPGIFSCQESLKPDAPKLQPQGNIAKHLVHEVGDINSGFEQAKVIVEGRFETPVVEHAYLEPEAAVGFVGDDGKITVKAPTQFPFELRKQISAVLNLPEGQVRVTATPLGGGFGSKLDNTVEALVALGAYHLRRPVKITLSREESLRLSTKRHAYWMDYRVGVDADGGIVAVDAKLLSDAGPYTALSPRVIDQACIFSCGPYRVPNLRVEGWAVFTNNANASAFRGFGINQAAVAIESLLDDCARRLGMDPFELRLKNALRVGDKTISGEILTASVAIEETIRAARDALQREMPFVNTLRSQGKKIGIGIASGFKNVGAGKGKVDDAGAIFSLQPGGRVMLRASAVDMGQGIRTALLQIAAEVLGIEQNIMDIITGDTELTIRHGGAVGERQTLISGKAVELGAREFKARLLAKASELIGVPITDLELDGAKITDRTGLKSVSLATLAQAGPIDVSYTYTAPKTYALADKAAKRTVPAEEYRNYPAYAYTTQAAVVEVDDKGNVKVLKIIAAHDCGLAINPQKIEGQIEGSCLQGLGYALSEGFYLEKGLPVTRTFGQLKVPTIFDAPEIQTILIEDPEPSGPFGAKGVSEVATVPVTPAILNAVCDATGVRFFSLPVTPRKILAALKEAGHS